MQQKPEQLYLELIKKTLSFTLWPEPPIPIGTLNSSRRSFRNFLTRTISRLMALRDYQIVAKPNYSEADRKEGLIWPGYAHTMIGLKRLDNLQYCAETVIRENVPGDFIETGVWRGGSCIFMRAIMAAHGVTDRKVYVADSFEGLPKPDAEKYKSDEGDKHHEYQALAISVEEVRGNFEKYGLLDEQVVFLKGWFKDSLPKAPIKSLAILRLDGDMYESTMDALNNLYDKLSPGGFCIVDDYVLPCCEAAVRDYRNKHGITSEIKEIDRAGRYWRKE